VSSIFRSNQRLMAKLALFEDAGVLHLKPLVHTRPAFDLRPGILSVRQRLELDLGKEADVLICRREVEPFMGHEAPGVVTRSLVDHGGSLLVNGRLLAAPADLTYSWRMLLEEGGKVPDKSTVWLSDGTVVAAWLPDSVSWEVAGAWPEFDESFEVVTVRARFLRRLWDLTSHTGAFISEDASAMGVRGVSDEAVVYERVVSAGHHFVAVGPGAVIEPGVVFVSEDGPIVVEPNAHVMAGAILRGPCHVGKGSHVRMGARLSATSVGEQCRVGGEVSNSVFHAFSNKAHDGYVGNSYIGAWCNLGADTNTSNLRNDYGEVTLFSEETGRYEASGQQFLGLIMGDHSRSGINTMFNTGTVVGVGCNVFGAGYQPRRIPSFSWGGKDRLMAYRPERAFESMRAMMARREQMLRDEEETALRTLFESSHPSGDSR